MKVIKKKKKKETDCSFASGFLPLLLLSLSLSLLPSITEKTMAQVFRRFPIISISLKYLRVWQKGTSFRVDRDLSRSLSNASLTMGSSALLFVPPPTYLTTRLPAFSFSCPTLRPLQLGYYRDTKGLRYRIASPSRRFYISNTVRKRMSLQRKYFPRPVDIESMSVFKFLSNTFHLL